MKVVKKQLAKFYKKYAFAYDKRKAYELSMFNAWSTICTIVSFVQSFSSILLIIFTIEERVFHIKFITCWIKNLFCRSNK